MNQTPPTNLGFQLHIDPFGRLVYRSHEGITCTDATPIRAYPISDPDHWIVLCDSEGRELCCVEDPAKLPAAVRSVLDGELARREFIPRIARVLAVSSYLEPAEWEVETDRGRTRFVLKSEDDVRRLGPHRALIQDAQGQRYIVMDTRALDPYSRRAVDRYL
jgi:hypothetical protein